MRLYVTGLAAAVALGIGLPGCVAPTELPFFYSASPNGVGATIGINPGLGALVGTEIGAPLGAAIGVATTHPLPDYKPIAVPASAVIPQYYDRWPPGYHAPPLGSWTPPPPPE
ncbi:MAG: hypothetical protein E6G72_07160 [Alphaproteobacteria bacterium]|nr:MAG: hypothetical protein E6G72_07160 [Alphaproteobacteria bacterium]